MCIKLLLVFVPDSSPLQLECEGWDIVVAEFVYWSGTESGLLSDQPANIPEFNVEFYINNELN